MCTKIDEILGNDITLQELKDNFVTEDIKKVDDFYIKHLYYKVNRSATVIRFTKILNDIDKSNKIEQGIFEFTITYAVSKNYELSMFPAIYVDKVNELELNLKPSYLNNKTLRGALDDGIDPRTLAFLRPQDIHPESWSTIIKKFNIREDKKNNMDKSDLYTCEKCEGKNCRMIELQLRSADEPTTKIITCMDCYHVEQRE